MNQGPSIVYFDCFHTPKKLQLRLFVQEHLTFVRAIFLQCLNLLLLDVWISDNGSSPEEWLKFLMSGNLTDLLTLRLLFLDSDTDPDISVLLIVIFSMKRK